MSLELILIAIVITLIPASAAATAYLLGKVLRAGRKVTDAVLADPGQCQMLRAVEIK